jgi:protein Tex
MNQMHQSIIAQETRLAEPQIAAVALLLEQDATVPFIARYRKEATGSLDEVAITTIRDRLGQLEELDNRKGTILKSLEQHGHLTDALKETVLGSETLSDLEDIYLPFRPKRRTRATLAREKGLEPLALLILEQKGIILEESAQPFVNSEKGVLSATDAISGATDIIAELINEDVTVRTRLRNLFASKGVMKSSVSTGMEAQGVKYKDYFEWEEPAATAPSHRILAMRRGEKEDILNLSIAPTTEMATDIIEEIFVTGSGEDSLQVTLAVRDSYKRLLSRSMETEIRLSTKERADTAAISIFADNLRQLLLSPPLGARRVMAVDPGFRTGCKIACLDRQGKFLHHDTIYPHTSEAQRSAAGKKTVKLCEKYRVEAIAVGNGTAGRETETFLRELPLADNIQIVLVNESGASIYSASETAREEFSDLDLTIRGAISIGRRLMDPLSELVKIDPKSIGVGQYQHDVDQLALKQSLDDVVTSCVNGVGVDVNRASAELLTYVSGLGPSLAKNILTHRNENGPFTTKNDLKKVNRLGPKAFEQAAGFLRIRDGKSPLDNSAVHPESYHIVDSMATDLDTSVDALISNPDLREKIHISNYVTETTGIPTLKDIVDELAKPGRDPRDQFEKFEFTSGIEKINDLRPGMKLPGIVTNITAFGAFVDVGVHQDGLVHISQMADRFVKDPSELVKVQQKVSVTVLEVDLPRKRISLSMKKPVTGGNKKNSQKKPHKKPAAAKGPMTVNKPPSKEKRPFNNPFAELFGKQ